MQHSPDLQQLLWPGDFYVNFDILLYPTFLRQLYRARLYWSSESSGLDEFTRSLWKLPPFQGACSMFRRTHHQWDVCSGLPRILAIWWPYGVAYATGCPRPLGCQGKLVKLGAGPDHLRCMHCFVRCWWPSPSCRTPGIYAAQPLWLWLRWEQAVQAFPPRRLPCCLCSFMMGLYFQQRCGCLFWTICPSFQSRR